jgi:dephospho-CoA kinase
VVRIGCTGAIGSGKSTVAAMLAAHGAVVIDADLLAREAISPRGPGYEAVVERFGTGVVLGDGSLDRGALAEVVFADAAARRDLEAIVHPVVAEGIAAQLARPELKDATVVLDVALLVETGGRRGYGLDGVLVVDAPEELCVARLVEHRSMSEAAARARLAAQLPRAQRLRAADFIIMNLGSLDELEAMVGEAWSWITALAEAGAGS